jgi:flavine halogenase
VLVIQGSADLGPRISENEVQNALDFCSSLFNPINQGVADDLRKHLEGLDDDQFAAHGVEKSALMDVNAPILPTEEIEKIARDPSLLPAVGNGSAEKGENEVQRVLERINARRMIHQEHSGLHSLEEESLGAGYRIRLERGRLGLTKGKDAKDA